MLLVIVREVDRVGFRRRMYQMLTEIMEDGANMYMLEFVF